MNRKLESVKPYVKFLIQHSTGQPIKDSDIDLLCNKNGELISVQDVGEGYILFSKTRFMKREELENEHQK